MVNKHSAKEIPSPNQTLYEMLQKAEVGGKWEGYLGQLFLFKLRAAEHFIQY